MWAFSRSLFQEGHSTSTLVWRVVCSALRYDLSSSVLVVTSFASRCALTYLIWIIVSASPAFAQESVEEVRNSYNFLQAGLSTLASAASAALCLARGRLDSEMGVADFFTMSSFRDQNDYGSKVSDAGNNGIIIGVSLAEGKWNHNTLQWIAHNTWAQGSFTTLVKFCVGVPPEYQAVPGTHTSVPSTPPSSSGSQVSSHAPAVVIPCTCWHIPSIAGNSSGRTGGLASLREAIRVDPQCVRVPSYQCPLHGQGSMPILHEHVLRELAKGSSVLLALSGSSKFFEYMLDDVRTRERVEYFFGVDNAGAKALKRMISESMATKDASDRGRTSDLVDWSLGKVEITDRPDIAWIGTASTVILVDALELVLMVLLCVVFGLDPFVSSLGARRGVRSLRLGQGGVTVFADLWMFNAKGYFVEGWEQTPIVRVKPRPTRKLWYFDMTLKVGGLAVTFAFWIVSVFGYVHPLGLERRKAWANEEKWSIYLGAGGSVIGFLTSAQMTGSLQRFAPTMSKRRGYYLLRVCWIQCMVEFGLSLLRVVYAAKGKMRSVRGHGDGYWIVLPCWYVVMETGIWIQWVASKRMMYYGPHSQSWPLTMMQAGAFMRATVLSAVSGSWSNHH
ncbi:hypothetical protein KP509_08G065200 [Ceratopteris richardii]|uniref:Uncharacterized protein n=1 Tax=Ceratopteris richardii TaxID=49495 RepID=A0A8T2UB60_CERRI|nr:hypothetical protein KP509_08G065200 [Ceratopteris richardii]